MFFLFVFFFSFFFFFLFHYFFQLYLISSFYIYIQSQFNSTSTCNITCYFVTAKLMKRHHRDLFVNWNTQRDTLHGLVNLIVIQIIHASDKPLVQFIISK